MTYQMQSSQLTSLHGPFVLLRDSARELNLQAEYGVSDMVVRKLRGKKCGTIKGFMNEIGAALQFFDGFGENGNALRECLSYLDEWLPATGYVLVFTQAERVLTEKFDDRLWLLELLNEVEEWWRTPIVDQAQFNRPARPFKVVFECQTDPASWIEAFEETIGEKWAKLA